MLQDYLCIGGVEIGNSARARGYAESADCPVNWFVGDQCETLADALGDDLYTIDRISEAPWYDPSLPETSRFYGLYITSLGEVSSSTRSGNFTEGILDGGTPGRVRHTGKSFRVRGWMTADGEDALEAGMSWLNASLEGQSCGTHAGGACGASDATLFTACPPARRLVPGFTPWVQEAENVAMTPSFELPGSEVTLWESLATNPSFESGSGTVEIFRNLFTNPSFAAGSSTIEVRRNLALNPRQVGSGNLTEAQTRYGSQWSRSFLPTTSAPFPGGPETAARVTATEATTGAGRGFDWYGNPDTGNVNFADAPSVSPGQTVTVRAWIRSNRSIPQFGIGIRFFNATTSSWVSSLATASVSGVGGQWHLVTLTAVAPVSSTNFVIRGVSNIASFAFAEGDVMDQTGLYIGIDDAGSYFDGTVQAAPDADLTASWTGTANASASVLQGVSVAGVSTTQCVAIRSSKFGGSMRLIPTTASNNSYAEASPAPGLLAPQTIMGTVHIEAPLTGSLHERRLNVASATPVGWPVPIPPNEAGSYDRRGVMNPTGQGRLIFMHGGSQGSGDVYWTKGALVAGDYTGPWFDGSHPHPDPDFTTAWAGSADASASVVTGVAPATPLPGSAPDNSISILSSDWAASGARSLRVISSGSTSSRYRLTGYNATYFQPGKMYTVLATVRLAVAQSGSLSTTPRSIVAATNAGTIESVTAPNTPGEHPLRLTFTVPPSANWATVLLMNGAASGEVWFDDLLIIEGPYVGPYFDGNSPLADIDFTTAWTGAADASTTKVTAVGLEGVTPAGGAAIQSSAWSKSGARSLRIITTGLTAAYAMFPAQDLPSTAIVTAHLENPLPVWQPGTVFPSLTNGAGVTDTVPNVAGDHDLRIEAPLPAGIYLTGGGSTGDSVWYDAFGIFVGTYEGEWFDGDTQPETGVGLTRTRWLGTPGLSSSTLDARETHLRLQTDEEYDIAISPFVRHMHDVICISGPLEIETRRSRDGRHWGRLVEFTLYAGKPWFYGETRRLELSPTQATVVQDTPFNLVPTPSPENAGDPVVVATNYSTNPSVEVDDAGWDIWVDNFNNGGGSFGRVVGQIAAAGVASYYFEGAAFAAGSDAKIGITHTVTIPAATETTRMSATIWCTGLLTDGTAQLGDLAAQVLWYDGATLLDTQDLGSIPISGGPISAKSLKPPVGATEAVIRAYLNIITYSTGARMRIFADAAGITVP